MQELDYDELWKRSYEARKRIESRDPGISYWDQRAEDFSEMRKTNGYEYGKKVLDALRYIINPEAEVLDIGAGPGTFVIPFAARVKRVTAVEPSLEMIGMIRKNALEAGIENFKVINKTWQDVDVAGISGKYNLVICSMVLWIFEDVWHHLRRMEQASRGYCCVVASTTGCYSSEWGLWRQIMGDVEEPESSGYPLIYNLIYAKGRSPIVEIIDYTIERSVESEIRQRMLMFGKYKEITPDHERAIRDYVTAHAEDGRYRAESKAAVISWNIDETWQGCASAS